MLTCNDAYRSTFSRVRDGIKAIPGLELAGQADAACVAFRCTSGPPQKAYQVAAALKELSGWNLNYCQKPICVQVQVRLCSCFVARPLTRAE